MKQILIALIITHEEREEDLEFKKKVAALTDLSKGDLAGTIETSDVMYPRPELVKIDRANDESGMKQNRLSLDNVYTPIGWYAGYPNHYDGDGSKASFTLGKLTMEHVASTLATVLKAVKADRQTLRRQNEFFNLIERK